MKQLLSCAGIVVALAGCQSATTAETDGNLARAQEIYAEAIEVHDEVMPRMDEIMQLRQKLRLRVESLREEDSVGYADSLRQMENAVQHLQEADQAMMQWMRNVRQVPGLEDLQSDYQDELETQPADTANVVEVQLEQKEAIVTVKEQMEASIDEAQRLIGLPE